MQEIPDAASLPGSPEREDHGVLTEDLARLGKEYQLAKSKYEQAVRSIIRNSATMQNKAIFWKMVDDLAGFVQRSLLHRDDPVRHGIEFWLREVQLHGGEGYDFDDIPSFIRTYSKLKEAIARSLLAIDVHLTDVIDALPLAGKQTCLFVLGGEVKALEELPLVVHKHGRLETQVLNKENHVGQWLEQSYSDRLCGALTGLFS